MDVPSRLSLGYPCGFRRDVRAVYPRDGRKVQFSPASVARGAGTARAADVIFPENPAKKRRHEEIYVKKRNFSSLRRPNEKR